MAQLRARNATIGSMNDLASLSRMLENLICFGVIAAVQMDPPRLQVKNDALTTAWLLWFALRAGFDREHQERLATCQRLCCEG